MKRSDKCGRRSFSHGVELFADQIAPGLGLFIRDCIKKVIEDQGLTYKPMAEKISRKDNKEIDQDI